MKSQDLSRRPAIAGGIGLDRGAYDVEASVAKLGDGMFGKVIAAVHRGEGRQPVAIKLLQREHCADAEVRRLCALPSHPHIVRLLDVGFFEQVWRLGLVFERFHTDVRQFLQTLPLKVTGQRHVLRAVLAALAHMHEHGLVHADVNQARQHVAARRGEFSRRFPRIALQLSLIHI